MEEKILEYRNKSKEELKKISRDSTRSEEDIIIASIELAEKEISEGIYYTTEQVLERIFGQSRMVNWCKQWFNRNL